MFQTTNQHWYFFFSWMFQLTMLEDTAPSIPPLVAVSPNPCAIVPIDSPCSNVDFPLEARQKNHGLSLNRMVFPTLCLNILLKMDKWINITCCMDGYQQTFTSQGHSTAAVKPLSSRHLRIPSSKCSRSPSGWTWERPRSEKMGERWPSFNGLWWDLMGFNGILTLTKKKVFTSIVLWWRFDGDLTDIYAFFCGGVHSYGGPPKIDALFRLENPNLLLVGGLNPSEKYESQLGWLFPIYGKMPKMFQTTNQIINDQQGYPSVTGNVRMDFTWFHEDCTKSHLVKIMVKISCCGFCSTSGKRSTCRWCVRILMILYSYMLNYPRVNRKKK